ncbi:bacterio-opsin activator domain-containing protein [Halopiger djelfimassiliensis]|uniref:bacterio-opsin activator domain-containing protein n=1 Tax=Halopiger djelfimassiliensis TaxID=1293047 RepID=UPI0006779629|nr:bacterio-opsin activator domain-containing protein [Halopiger djelfimassiliensis]
MTIAADLAWEREQLLAASLDATAVIDGRRYASVNQPYAELYGFATPDALAGQPWDRRLAAGERSRFEREILPACRLDGRWRGTVTGRRRDGSPFPQVLSIARLDDERFLCICRAVERHRRVGEPKPGAVGTVSDEPDESAPFAVVRLDADFRITYANTRAEEIIGPAGTDSPSVLGVDIRNLPPIVEAGHADRFTRLQNGGTIEFEVALEPSAAAKASGIGRGVALSRDGEFAGALLLLDTPEGSREKRDLGRRRDEYPTPTRVNDLLLGILRDLYDASTRTEIEQGVCDRLAASELYQFVWIGEPHVDGKRIVPRATGGIDDGIVETIPVTTAAGEGDPDYGPDSRAFHTETVHVSHDVSTDPTFGRWQAAALDRGIESVAAVPLVHRGTTYGVLGVYTARPLAFDRRERAGFETLGNAVGFAINAVENRRVLFADTIVELEFEVTDPGLVFVRISEKLGCELTVTGPIESASGDWCVYLTVDGATPAAVRTVTTDDPDIERVRVIADEADAGALEVVTTEPPLSELTDHGAVLTSGTVDDGRGRFSIEAPGTADIRRLTDRLRTAYPDSTLVAQREFDRPVQRAVEIRQSIDDRLTDRQREALVRAYHAGYFDWPRRSTAGDVAESMDIAETTFHYHLRRGLDTLLTAFDGGDGATGT